MKKQILGWISSIAFLTVFPVLFLQCETDLNKLDQVQTAKMSAVFANSEFTGGDPTDLCECLTTQFPKEELSAAEIKALKYLREEQKLAHDYYVGMYDLWQVPVFNNISQAEQRHMDAIGCLLQKYEIKDPVGENGIGVFQNADLQKLYNDLYAQGKANLQVAYTAGAKIEDLDIHDLQARLDEPTVDNKDVVAVFGDLNKGSRNHMRAFSGKLEGLGVTYAPQHLTAESYQNIVTTDWERGGSTCCPYLGQGPVGKGPGKAIRGNGPGKGFRGNCPRQGSRGNCPYGNDGNGPRNGQGRKN